MLLHCIVTCLIALITLIKERKCKQKMALKNLNSGGSQMIKFRLLTILSLLLMFFFRSDQQLSSHTGQYSRERSQRLACAISTKDDERPAGSVKLLYTYILSSQELDPKSWNMFCFQAPIIRSKKM